MNQTNKLTQSEKIIKRIVLSDALIIGFFTLFGYTVLFCYEWGYFTIFRIPLQFMNFDIAEIFVVTTGLIVLFWASLLFTNIIYRPYFEGHVPPPVAKRMTIAFPIYFAFIALLLLYRNLWSELAPYIIAAIMFTLSVFLPPLITKKVKGSYIEKMILLDELERKQIDEQKQSLTNIFTKYLGPEIILGLLIFSIALFIAYHAGRAGALSVREFRVVNTTPETVVLYVKSDKVIVAPLDRTRKLVEPAFMVINYSDNPDLQFRIEEVGPLKLNEEAIKSKPAQTPTPRATSTITITPTVHLTLTEQATTVQLTITPSK